MWFPNDPFIIGYMQFARVFSVFFLSYQAILMLIVAYVINGLFVGNVKNGQAGSAGGIALLVTFGLFTAGNIVWIVFQFIEFSGCGGNIAIMCVTAVIAAVLYALPLLRLRQDASIFTSALVVTYCLYLQWSAFSSDYRAKCNPYNPYSLSGKNYKANTICMMVFGLVFTFMSLLVVGGKSKAANEEE